MMPASAAHPRRSFRRSYRNPTRIKTLGSVRIPIPFNHQVRHSGGQIIDPYIGTPSRTHRAPKPLGHRPYCSLPRMAPLAHPPRFTQGPRTHRMHVDAVFLPIPLGRQIRPYRGKIIEPCHDFPPGAYRASSAGAHVGNRPPPMMTPWTHPADFLRGSAHTVICGQTIIGLHIPHGGDIRERHRQAGRLPRICGTAGRTGETSHCPIVCGASPTVAAQSAPPPSSPTVPLFQIPGDGHMVALAIPLIHKKRMLSYERPIGSIIRIVPSVSCPYLFRCLHIFMVP